MARPATPPFPNALQSSTQSPPWDSLANCDPETGKYRHRFSAIVGLQSVQVRRSSNHLRLHQCHPILFPESGSSGQDRSIPSRQPARYAKSRFPTRPGDANGIQMWKRRSASRHQRPSPSTRSARSTMPVGACWSRAPAVFPS